MSLRTMYLRLRSFGITPEGIKGIFVNTNTESKSCAYRYQGDKSVGYQLSVEWTASIDRGERDEWMKNKQGYGLCQWGEGRKYRLLLLSRERGCSVGNEMLACDYIWQELQDDYYTALRNLLLTTDNYKLAAYQFCKVFERPGEIDIYNRLKRARDEGIIAEIDALIAEEKAMCNVKENAASWMTGIAGDDSHGYDQLSRWGADYDCSSLVIAAYKQAGLALTSTYTGDMYDDFIAHGFEDVTAQIDLVSGGGLEYGDVLLNKVHHTAMYIGDGQICQASINERGKTTGGQTGDQTGREIYIRGYYNYPWDCVLRYAGMSGGYAGSDDGEDDEVVYVTPDKPTATKATCTVVLPELKQGCTGAAVKSLQTLLISQSCSCGGCGADGVFGGDTLKAVTAFQRSRGLDDDGICGRLTWARLLGGSEA